MRYLTRAIVLVALLLPLGLAAGCNEDQPPQEPAEQEEQQPVPEPEQPAEPEEEEGEQEPMIPREY